MSIAPRGMSVQEAYRLYADGHLLVNRGYQRKLVWTEKEKQKLIDSILRGYPIPLILLAERPKLHGMGKYEIMDGVQRFNAIFAFIENAYSLNDACFDINQFARAKQGKEAGLFTIAPQTTKLLSPQECANFLDYQLAVTIYPSLRDEEITAVFGRINSGGKQLSSQEKRQAGVVSPFAELVRKLASEVRGDASKDILLLSEMPEISIDSRRARQTYGITAEDIFWCKQGILWTSQLRDSEDEEMIADIAASILLKSPFASSKEKLDELYDLETELSKSVEAALAAYGAERLLEEMKFCFSILRETIESYSGESNALRSAVAPGSTNPIKASFYAIFMAFFDLIFCHDLSPADPQGIVNALKNLQSDMIRSAHYATTEDRRKNIDKTTGLIQRYFVKKDTNVLGHGAALAIDFENSLRRSSIETPRYELKQGLLSLASPRIFNSTILQKIIETICGIANVGPESNGYIFIGVADKKEDANLIQKIDSIQSITIGQRHVVGVDREARLSGITMNQYLEKLLGFIKSSKLSEPLKQQVLAKIDVITYRGYTIVRITIPPQSGISFVDKDAFVREGSSTVKIAGPQVVNIDRLFRK